MRLIFVDKNHIKKLITKNEQKSKTLTSSRLDSLTDPIRGALTLEKEKTFSGGGNVLPAFARRTIVSAESTDLTKALPCFGNEGAAVVGFEATAKLGEAPAVEVGIWATLGVLFEVKLLAAAAIAAARIGNP